MRGLALLFVIAACGGEKMTPEKCVKTMSRMEQRTEECLVPPGAAPAAPHPDGPAALDDDEMMMGELCNDEQMQQMATSTLPCLEQDSCADYLACLRRPDLGDAVRKLVQPR